MILPGTPCNVILKTILDEQEKVDFFMRKEMKTVHKKLKERMLEMRPFPFLHHVIYTIPKTRNKYLVWYSILDPNDLKKGKIEYDYCLIIDEGRNGISVYTPAILNSVNNGKKPVLLGYTGHFFYRYRERQAWGAKIPTSEVIARYMSRNVTFMARLDFNNLQHNAHKYPNGVAYQVDDGVIFGTISNETDYLGNAFEFIKCNTFLSQSLLKDEQLESLYDDEALAISLMKTSGLPQYLQQPLTQNSKQ